MLVLDNFEMVLGGETGPGTYRLGYQDYGYLLSRISQEDHNSTVIITSRELPPEVGRYETRSGNVRSLKLGGLGPKASKNIFSTIGKFSGSADDWDDITTLYNGNPLALELAARHIKEVFGGSLIDFRQHGTHVFGDLKELLDWHFERCSPEQREMMYWLAIGREPQSIQELISDSGKRNCAELIQQLGHSIPLQRSIAGFSMQPVLIEYVSERLVERVTDELAVGRVVLVDSHPLLKATAKEHIKETQRRLILGEVANLLTKSMNISDISAKLQQVLTNIRRMGLGGYGAGNVLNLIMQLGLVPGGFDFSALHVRQADLKGAIVRYTNFERARFGGCTFTETFSGILSLAFNATANRLAASTDAGEIRVWSVPDAKSEWTIKGHDDWAWAIEFSTDSQVVLSAGSDRTIKLWDVEAATCIRTLEGHTSEVRCLAVSPDGAMIASGSQDQSVRLWSMSDGQCINILAGHEHEIRSVAFSPDGRLIASGSKDRTTRLWLAHSGMCTHILVGHSAMIRSVTFSPDGSYIATGGDDGTIRLWEVETGQCIRTLDAQTGWVFRAVFTPDGRYLASINEDGTIRIWDTGRWECVKSLQSHASRLSTEAALAFSENGKFLASGALDKAVRLWDPDSGECLRTMEGYANPFYSCVFVPNTGFLIGGCEDRDLVVWDSRTHELERTLEGHSGAVWALAVSSDNSWIASGATDRTVRLWQLDSGECMKVLRGHTDRINAVAFSPNSELIASASGDYSVRLWPIDESMPVKALRGHTNTVWSVAFDPTGRLLASGGEDGKIYLWDTLTGDLQTVLEGHEDRVYSIAFSPSGLLLASGSSDSTVGVWDVKDRVLVGRLEGHRNRIRSVSFEGKDRLLASGGVDGDVRIWDIRAGRCLQTLRGHSDIVWAVAWNGSGSLVASASNDGTVRLWNIATSACTAILRGLRPYEDLNLVNALGLTPSQLSSLSALGAITREQLASRDSGIPWHQPRRVQNAAKHVKRRACREVGTIGVMRALASLAWRCSFFPCVHDEPWLSDPHWQATCRGYPSCWSRVNETM